MLQDPPDSHGGSDLVLWHTDTSSDQILWRLNVRVRAHKDERVSKESRGKNRYRDQARITSVACHQIGTHGTLGSVELLVTKHAPKRLFDVERQISQLHAFDLNLSFLEGARTVILPA